MARATMYFPEDFLWGTATSAYQVEGNSENSDWWQWESGEGHITNGAKSGLADDWWQHAEKDLDSAAEMGNNAHRLSIEWSRIEPTPSIFDESAIARYREILQALHDREIEPMVTLHHYSNPLWLVEKGDFESDLVVDYFKRYTAKVVGELGDLIPKWVTFNEPITYVRSRYLESVFPEPVNRGKPAALRATGQMLRCHAAAYHTIKETYPESLVGVAKLFRRENSQGAWLTNRITDFLDGVWMKAMITGRLRWPVGRGQIEMLAGSFDFVGLNYDYHSSALSASNSNQTNEARQQSGPTTGEDSSLSLSSAGLFKLIKENLRFGKPIYITKIGLPDATDQFRPSFLLSHLREVWRAVSFNFPVKGYYHWSLVDNFEWDQGWSQCFGLIEVDPENQNRRWRRSARLYSEICHSGSISSFMAERYASELMETMFPGQAPENTPTEFISPGLG